MIIVINRHIIRANKKNNTRKPPIRVSRTKYSKPVYYKELTLPVGCKVIYNPDKPLPCGATVWIEAP